MNFRVGLAYYVTQMLGCSKLHVYNAILTAVIQSVITSCIDRDAWQSIQAEHQVIRFSVSLWKDYNYPYIFSNQQQGYHPAFASIIPVVDGEELGYL